MEGVFTENFDKNYVDMYSTRHKTSLFQATCSITRGNFELGILNFEFRRRRFDSVPVSNLEAFLRLTPGSLDNLGNGDAIEGSAIRQTFTANAGDVLTFDFNFLVSENTPSNFNDFAFTTIVNSPSELADTGFANGTGSGFIVSNTDFTEETGFQDFSFTIPRTGTYTLGLGVVDVGNEFGDAQLLVDNIQITSYSDSFIFGETSEDVGKVTTAKL